MLMHHADPAVDRHPGRVNLHRFPVDQDLSRISLVQPIQDVHQGGLAGSVLAEQRQHFPGRNFNIHMVVAENAGESFYDPPHLQLLDSGVHFISARF